MLYKFSFFAILFFFFASLSGQVLSDPNLCGYWEFQNNAKDRSSKSLHGVLIGGPTFGTDHLGKASEAIIFDGINDWVNFGDHHQWSRFRSTESFSLCTWVLPEKPFPAPTNTGHGDFLRYDDFDDSDGDSPNNRNILLYRLRYFDQHFVVEFSIGKGPSNFSSVLSTPQPYGRWCHFAAVRDAQQRQLLIYVNGCLNAVAIDDSPLGWETTGQYLMCGKYESAYHESYFRGRMAALQIFRRRLEKLEVQELANVKGTRQATVAKRICEGEQYEGYNQSGQYTKVIPLQDGCDSTLILNLEVIKTASTFIQANLCPGENIEGYSQAGVYVDTFASFRGCDSIRSLRLVSSAAQFTVLASICEGEAYGSYNKTGVYVDTFTNASGCDSIRLLRLSVLPKPSSTAHISICRGGTFDGLYTQTGVYKDTLKSFHGCDSIRTIYLEVVAPETYIPNAFSPNDDGKNDCFEIQSFNEPLFELLRIGIYSRFGELLYETRDPDFCWDGRFRGKDLQPGVYTYLLEYLCGGKRTVRTGDITLIR